MKPSNWKQIKEALANAIELPSEEREDLLSSLPAAVRERVTDLLKANAEAGDFISSPAVVDHGIAEEFNFISDEEQTPEFIDEYRIIRRIGTGGMGTVYLAERDGGEFSQRVALKLIKRGMDTDLVLKRFMMERRILAELEHPNIARMIDGGSTNDGLPYFVMEYVEGSEIRKYCSDESLGLNERLKLFRKICAAVQYAHRNLVIHRDIKPTNILVAKEGEPKLLDFGIAKLMSPDMTESTVTEIRVLTPEYASPEQLAGERVSTLTDVYSLGIILHELLTGVRPFDLQATRSVNGRRNAYTTELPPLPSSTATTKGNANAGVTHADIPADTRNTERVVLEPIEPRYLRGDLDNIILKAIHYDNERRYRSVEEFSEDIKRYMTGLPVSAAADSNIYRFKKFVERNRTSFMITSTAALLLLILSGVSVWQAVRANNERNVAEQRFSEVRELANYLIFDAHDSIKDLPGATAARKQHVEQALKYLNSLAAEAGNDMELKRELAAGYEKIADVQGNPMLANLGEFDAALKSYEQALAIREEIAAVEKKTEDIYSTAILHSKIVRLLQLKNRSAEAEEHLKQAEERMQVLAASEPSNLLYQVTLARFSLELGDTLSAKNGSEAAAAESYYKSIAALKAVGLDDASKARQTDGISLFERALSVEQLTYRRLGQMKEVEGDLNAALENYLHALSAAEQFYEHFDKPHSTADMVYAISLGNVARMQAAAGKNGEAQSKAAKMIDMSERLAANDRQNKLATGELAVAYYTRGYVNQKAGDTSSAINDYRRSVEIGEKINDSDPENIYNLGNLSRTLNSLASAEAERAAKTANQNERSQLYEKARVNYLQSERLLKEVDRIGRLPGYLRKVMADAEDGIRRLSEKK